MNKVDCILDADFGFFRRVGYLPIFLSGGDASLNDGAVGLLFEDDRVAGICFDVDVLSVVVNVVVWGFLMILLLRINTTI